MPCTVFKPVIRGHVSLRYNMLLEKTLILCCRRRSLIYCLHIINVLIPAVPRLEQKLSCQHALTAHDVRIEANAGNSSMLLKAGASFDPHECIRHGSNWFRWRAVGLVISLLHTDISLQYIPDTCRPPSAPNTTVYQSWSITSYCRTKRMKYIVLVSSYCCQLTIRYWSIQ